MLLPQDCVVAVVDGKSFDIYRNTGSEADPKLSPVDPPELESNGHSDVGHRSSPGNHADRQMDEDARARALTLWLNDQVLSHQIKDLIIIAAPRTLGEMRRHYHDKTREVLRKELSKDLVGSKPQDVIAALR